MTAIKRVDWFAVFRVLFGCLIITGCMRFFFNGWIHDLYVLPRFHFTFTGFPWVQVLPPAGMYVIFFLMAAAGLAIALNKWFRAASIVFFLTFTYVELIDVTYYLNHYYLVTLLAFLLIFYDSRRSSSSLYNQRVIFFLKLQLSIVYFFGGINKLESDWMFHAQPLQIWLRANSDLPVIGPWLAAHHTAFVVAWLAILFDVGMSILLWFRPTRGWSYAALCVFHLATAALFHIGMFPWIMMVSTLLFFHNAPPARQLFASVYRSWKAVPVAAFALWQVAFPLRHLLYPGNYLWTEQGFRFAWNIMLIEKNGTIDFGYRDSARSVHDVPESEWLTPFQLKMVSTQPDLILQFAQWVKQHRPDAREVFAEAYVSLNGRPSQLYFDPRFNLITTPDELYKNIRLHSPVH